MPTTSLPDLHLARRGLRTALLAGTALMLPSLAEAQPAPNARPQGGQVVAGSATIGGDAGRTVIQQSTDRAAINWQSFDVGRNQAVQFQQPSSTSVTLNRVITPNPSQIAGQITANGQIAIVNQSGVVFHQGSTVNAAGLVVSTANITNEAFMRGGRMNFDQPGRPDARIETNGTITVREAGLAALVAPQVANRGVIRARAGRVVLAGAETSVVDLHGDGLLSLEITSPVRQAPTNGEALVTNTGTVTATGGTVVLTASAVDGIVQDLVRASGRIAANTDAATGRTGRVVVAGNGGAVRIEGTVSAQGRAAGTTGGDIQILGDRNLVDSTARVNASGRAGGGTIAIGGTAPRNTSRLSQRTGIAQGAVVRADATERGNGGTVVVNSSEYTVHAGALSARGAGEGGNGGFIEVSGQQGLAIMGAVDVGAGPNGRGGTFLIDPTTITIVADGTGGINTSVTDFTGAILGSASPPPISVIAAGIVNDPVFNNATIELQATQTITVNAAINRTTIGGLTLTAGTNIVVNAPITIASGDLTMTGQNITISGALLTQNGGISLTTTSSLGTLTINSDVRAIGGNIGLTGASYTTDPSILLGATVQVDGDRRITTQGNIATSNNLGRFVGGELNVTLSGTNTELLNDNQIDVLVGMDSSGANRFRNIGSLRVTGGVGGTVNSFTSIDVVGGDLTIAGFVGGGGGFGNVEGAATLLRASGNITLEGNGGIGSPTIRAQAGYDFSAAAPNPTAAGGILLQGTIGGYGGGSATTIELAAGLGGISQTGGSLQASSLVLQTGGSATFSMTPQFEGSVGFGAAVDALSGNVSGNLTLNSTAGDQSTVDLTLGNLTVGGTLSLIRNVPNGSIVQLEDTAITASQLDMQFTGFRVDLYNQNAISRLGTIDVVTNFVPGLGQGSFWLTTATDLTIAGPGRINFVGYSFGLRADGDLRLGAGSTFNFSPINTDSLSRASLSAGGTLAIGGSIRGTDATFLSLSGAEIVQTGGSIATSDLVVSATGNAYLDGASAGQSNQVENLSSLDVGGNFVLDNGISNLSVSGSIFNEFPEYRAGTFSIRTAGNVAIYQDVIAEQRATFLVGGLSGLRGVQLQTQLLEVAPYSPQAMQLGGSVEDPGFVLSDNILAGIRFTSLRVGATTFDGVTTTTATNLTIPFSFTLPTDPQLPGSLDLRSLGDITQAPGTTLSAPLLTGQAGGNIALGNAGNDLAQIGDLSAGGTLTLRTDGSQILAGTLSGSTMNLTTGGTLTQGANGRVTGGTLRLNTAGNATLLGANAIAGLGASNVGGDLRLSNNSAQLGVAAGNLVFASGLLDINQAGSFVIDGTVSGSSTSLRATGHLQVNGNSAIARVGDLGLQADSFGLNGLLQAAGQIIVQAASSASLGGTAIGSQLGITAPNITFNGLNAVNTPVSLYLGAGGASSGALDTSALNVFGGSGTNLTGSIGGIGGGPAAALGRRGSTDGTLIGEPLPQPNRYLFNNCPIGVVGCAPIVIPPEPELPVSPTPVPPTPGGEVSFPPDIEPSFPYLITFDSAPFLAVSSNPLEQAATLENAATALQQLRAPTPTLSVRLYRDNSEEGELAPPNVRGEDF
ncbi:beta strand repeat-containing protein [Roseococcus pinisoli]|uniref:Filamentous hemagglutinin N-terminal domain-containing protein n=1 Tax=Roseococcus pinisoli TaxID=2835040 RepID=A0ABS5Q7Q6_9PROT|nr:filamentous hemagglutinin N-terminal domain-containing protein [Roseococcus pinisoli]MBS7809699.1 filamentous hemagglutinin N-terminal domain-containing protein [Roseococcus pinisoli]